MLRQKSWLRCSAAAEHTLTAWLSRLAAQADNLPPRNSAAATPSPTSSSIKTSSTATKSSTAASSVLSSSAEAAAGKTLHDTVSTLFREIGDAATHANALRETDTLFAVLHALLRKRYYPADVESWARLATQLLPYAGIESQSVLHYPGTANGVVRREDGHHHLSSDEAYAWGTGESRYGVRSTSNTTLFGSHNSSGSDRLYGAASASSSSFSPSAFSGGAYHLNVTRETLLMTGGVVPFSARVPCGDGSAVALLLDSFVAFVRESETFCGTKAATSPRLTPLDVELVKAVRAVSKAVLQSLQINAATLQWEVLLPSLLDYLQLLHALDLQSSAATMLAGGASAQGQTAEKGTLDNTEGGEGEEDVEDETTTSTAAEAQTHCQRTRLLLRMADGLSHYALADGAHGARAVLFYLNDSFNTVVEQFQHSESVTASLPAAEDVQSLYWAQQRYLLTLTRNCMRAIYLHYTPLSTKRTTHAVAAALSPITTTTTSSEAAGVSAGHPGCVPLLDLVLSAPMNATIDALYDQIDVMFQRNTNDGNPLQLEESTVSQLKDIHTLALLRALRLEEAAPDQYLRRALEVVDRVPASMAIEGELIAGKVRLLDLDSDTVDEAGRTAVYNDLLQSLRSLVEMRPRLGRQDGATSTSDATAASAGEGAAVSGEELDEDESGAAAVRVDAVTQGILQRAHADVITAFCAAHKEEWLNEAYSILVAHKYHGLKITKELIQPVLNVFSRRGDCRAFNLVDLCVLYSNETIDMNTIALLFRTCAAAGDHYRARTFLQLLNEIIPGFLVKCPPSVKESLRELKLLPPPPRHLFVSTEEDLVQSALGEERQEVRRLPDTL